MTNGTQRLEPQSGSIGENRIAQPRSVASITDSFDEIKVAAFIELYCSVYQNLLYETDLTPDNRESFGQILKLRNAVQQSFSDAETHAIITSPDVRPRTSVVRQLFGRAEHELAVVWSERMSPNKDLTQVKLFRHYDCQVNSELKTLGYPNSMPAMKDKHRILIVGAGPFPIEALLLADKIGKRTTCIDSDKESVERGRAMIQRLGYSDRVEYVHASADQYGYEDHPLVIMQNEVSNNFGVLNNIIEARWVEQLAIRDARGIYGTVYTPFPPDVATHFNLNFQGYAPEDSQTMQRTLFANILVSPDRAAKPGTVMTADEIYPFTLAEQQKAQLQRATLLPAYG